MGTHVAKLYMFTAVYKYVNMFVEITRDIYMNTQRHDVSECVFVCV